MWRELLVAMFASAAIGTTALLYDRYAYWRSYAPRRFPIGLSMYLALNATAGALGVATGALLSWEPRAGQWALNGLIFGFVGQGLVRVEPHRPELRYLEAGHSVLARTTRLVERFLEAGCELEIQRRLDELDDTGLYDQAFYLFGRFIDADVGIPHQSRARVKRQIVEAAEAIVQGNRGEGRGRLEQICFQEISERQLHPSVAWISDSTPGGPGP